MEKEARIAFIQAQTVCMYAEIEAMKAANRHRREMDEAEAYDEEAFADLCIKYGLHHNAVVRYLGEQ